MSFKNTDIGLIPEEWRFDTISDSLYIKGRIGWKGLKKSEYVKTSDYRIINGSNVINNSIDWSGCGYITKERYDESPEIMLKVNDIVMTKDGTIGKLAIIRELEQQTTVASGLFVIRVEYENIDVDYLYYYFTSYYFKELVKSRIEGSVIPHLYQKDLVALRLPLPDLNEQKMISDLLRSIDKKIETNNQINKTLENMAQAIFTNWFVDFEFSNEDGEPYKSSGGEMVESELGMIPKGWKVKPISVLCEVRDGTHDSPKPVENGYHLITSKHLKGNHIDFSDAKFISQEDYDKVNARSKVERYDILITMIGTVGNIYLVQDEKIDFAIKNVGLFRTSQSKRYYEYIYSFLKNEKTTQHIEQRLAGSTQKYISLTELRKIPIIVPTNETLNKYKQISKTIFEKVYSNEIEISLLQKTRDTLLPKLMSGEIRVPVEE